MKENKIKEPDMILLKEWFNDREISALWMRSPDNTGSHTSSNT